MPRHKKRTVVCLCGSTRFREEINNANHRLTLEGKIVLAPGVFHHQGDAVTPADKRLLDQLHRDKIAMADEVMVVCPGGYVGESTLSEIHYAEDVLGKPVKYWV